MWPVKKWGSRLLRESLCSKRKESAGEFVPAKESPSAKRGVQAVKKAAQVKSIVRSFCLELKKAALSLAPLLSKGRYTQNIRARVRSEV